VIEDEWHELNKLISSTFISPHMSPCNIEQNGMNAPSDSRTAANDNSTTTLDHYRQLDSSDFASSETLALVVVVSLACQVRDLESKRRNITCTPIMRSEKEARENNCAAAVQGHLGYLKSAASRAPPNVHPIVTPSSLIQIITKSSPP